jgi:MoxR-like ATPase
MAEAGVLELYGRVEKSGEWQVIRRFETSAQAVTVTDTPKERIRKNQGELKWRWNAKAKNGKFAIAQQNGNFVPVEGADEAWAGDDVYLEELSQDRIAVHFGTAQRVVILELKGKEWKIAYDLMIEKETPANTQEGRIVTLRGETGLAKGVLIRAAAALMNEQVFFIPANEDMEKEDLEYKRTLGVEEAGVSGYLPTIMTQVQHYGGWIVIDEAHKLRDKVANAMKPKIAAKRHGWWYAGEGDQKERHEVIDHPRARLLGTENMPRAGMVSISRHTDQAMQRRKRIIDFYWLEPSEEVQVHLYYAKQLAKLLGRYRHPDEKKKWTEADTRAYEKKMEDMISDLVRIAAHLRLVFAGYTAEQIKELLKPYGWRKLGTIDFAPKNATGEMLQRAPSPRALKNMVLHFIRFPEDWGRRKWSVVERYFNFYAEKDPEHTYESLPAKEFPGRGGFCDNPASIDLRLDESSFSVRQGKLVVRPVTAEGKPDPRWDEVVVPLHPEASMHRGILPEHIKWLLQSPETSMLIYRMLQAYESGRDVILVGEQETGKSTIANAVQELVGGPDVIMEAVSYQTSKEDLTYRPHMGEQGTFQSGFLKGPLPTAMNHKGHGKPIALEESNQARPGTLAVLNDVSDHRYLLDPSGKPEEVGEGFWMLHLVNQPEEGFEVREFSDEFLERHAIFFVKPLPAPVSSTYIREAGAGSGFQVNPHLIGEPMISDLPGTGKGGPTRQPVRLDEQFKKKKQGPGRGVDRSHGRRADHPSNAV